MKLLAIEDFEPFVAMLRSVFGRNLHIDSVPSLREALELLQTEKYDVILIDLTLTDSTRENTVDKIPEIRGLARGARLVVATGDLPPPPPDVRTMVDAVISKNDSMDVETLTLAIRG